jgi:hypothetical protein
MTDTASPVMPPPQGFLRRMVYRVGLWAYRRWCERDRHWLGPRRPKMFGKPPHQVTVLCRSCVLCGASRADSRDVGA